MILPIHPIGIAAILIAISTTPADASKKGRRRRFLASTADLDRPGRAEVPLPRPRGSGRASVQLMINGHGPYRFGVETGSPYIVISSTLAATLGLPHPENAPGPNSRRVDSMSISSAVTLRQVNVFAKEIRHSPGTRVRRTPRPPRVSRPAAHHRLPRQATPASSAARALPTADNITLFEALPLGPFHRVLVDVGGSKSSTGHRHARWFLHLVQPGSQHRLLLARAAGRLPHTQWSAQRPVSTVQHGQIGC